MHQKVDEGLSIMYGFGTVASIQSTHQWLLTVDMVLEDPP